MWHITFAADAHEHVLYAQNLKNSCVQWVYSDYLPLTLPAIHAESATAIFGGYWLLVNITTITYVCFATATKWLSKPVGLFAQWTQELAH